MRHAVAGRKLNRDVDHRRALRRNLVQSLIEHGEIRTTLVKAKEVRSLAEKIMTLAVKADAAATSGNKEQALAYRQRAIAYLNDRAIISPEMRADYDRLSDAGRGKLLRSRTGRRFRASKTVGGKATVESVINKLFATVGPRIRRRSQSLSSNGGYTRIIKLSDRRLGDASPTAILQIVKESDGRRPKTSDKSERKRRARVRYSVYAGKPRQQRGPRRTRKAAAGEPGAGKAGTPGGTPASRGTVPGAPEIAGETPTVE